MMFNPILLHRGFPTVHPGRNNCIISLMFKTWGNARWFFSIVAFELLSHGAAPIPPTFWWLPPSQCASHFPPILGTEQQDIIQFQSVGRATATPISPPPLFPIPDVIYCYKNVGGREGREGWRNGRRSYTDMAARRAREKEEGVSNVQNNTLWRLLLLPCRSVG